jgi:hypothetical protein
MTQLICGILRLDDAPPDKALVQRMAAAMTPPGSRPGGHGGHRAGAARWRRSTA